MKKLSLLICFISFYSFSQSTENLKVAAKKLYEANYTMDFEAIVSFTYPAVAENMGKEIMLEKLEKQYENEEYRLRLQLESVPFIVGKTEQKKGRSFCRITFRNPVRYTFENKLTDEQVAGWKAKLQEMNKTADVVFEPKRNSFSVRRQTVYIAVMDENTMGEWKLLNLDDPDQQEAYQKIYD
ncbi:MAG: hypothetical protein QM710_02470 [Flavobacterium sp.]